MDKTFFDQPVKDDLRANDNLRKIVIADEKRWLYYSFVSEL